VKDVPERNCSIPQNSQYEPVTQIIEPVLAFIEHSPVVEALTAAKAQVAAAQPNVELVQRRLRVGAFGRTAAAGEIENGQTLIAVTNDQNKTL
jgi:ABC-type phosphate/phosphonate transport system substrate-binding protein